MSCRMLVLALLALGGVAACDSPELVDCAPHDAPTRNHGRFVRVDADVFCVYPERARAECPSTLPERHSLSWGGYACAEVRHEALSSTLCAAVGECAPDASNPDGGS